MATDVTPLRSGPFAPLSVRKGDRAYCHYRNTEVVSTGCTEAQVAAITVYWRRMTSSEPSGIVNRCTYA